MIHFMSRLRATTSHPVSLRPPTPLSDAVDHLGMVGQSDEDPGKITRLPRRQISGHRRHAAATDNRTVDPQCHPADGGTAAVLHSGEQRRDAPDGYRVAPVHAVGEVSVPRPTALLMVPTQVVPAGGVAVGVDPMSLIVAPSDGGVRFAPGVVENQP